MYDQLYSSFSIAGAFLISLFLAYLITPLFRLIAIRLNFFDHPQSKKKSHARPMPLLGGLAIVFSFFSSLLLTTRSEKMLIPIFLGALVLIIFGLIDDRLGMMPNLKLAGQFIAALIVIRMGIKVDTIQYYHLSLIFTVLWIIGITNAFNLLDNLNGLSSGIAGISALFFGLIAWRNGQMFVATISFALAGACFGFLRHNFPKAKIFMGDSGSMFLGFLLACIAVLGTWETDKISLSLSLPILILGYPIFDTMLVTFLRIREKRSIFVGGRDHSSHILASMGLRKKRTVLLIYTISMLLGLSAFLIPILPVPIAVTLLVITTAGIVSFGIYLALKRLRSAKLRRQAMNG